MNALPVVVPMTPKVHIHVDTTHTVNGVPEHHQYNLDVSASQVIDEHMLQHLVNFGREAVNHDGQPKKYFATSPPKKETATCLAPCFH